MLLLDKINLANGVIPKMSEKTWANRWLLTIGFNVDDVILKVGMIILANQCVLALFVLQTALWKPEKHDIDIYIYISMGRILEYRYGYRWTNIDLNDNDIGSIDSQY